MYLYF